MVSDAYREKAQLLEKHRKAWDLRGEYNGLVATFDWIFVIQVGVGNKSTNYYCDSFSRARDLGIYIYAGLGRR